MRKLSALLMMLPLIAAAGGEYDYHFWFDSQFDGPLASSGKSSSSSLTINPDVSTLSEGIHTFNFYVSDPSVGCVTSIRSNYFLRLANGEDRKFSVQTLIDGAPFKIEEVTANGLTLQFDLDTSTLPYGLHALAVSLITETGAVSSTQEAMFFRMPTSAEMSSMKITYLIDGKEKGTASLNGDSALLQLDVSSIPCGLHEITIFASDGGELTTNSTSRLFMKSPGGIASYSYWINDDIDSARKVIVDPPQTELSIIDMLPVDEVPFRSKMFTCKPDASTGGLTLYACNELSAIFISEGNESVTYDNRQYTDTRVSRTVSADEIQPLSVGIDITETLPIPAENDIIWRSFDAEPGYLFNIKSSSNCQIDFFDPDGEKINTIESSNSNINQAIDLNKTGCYYIALHDFTDHFRQNAITYTYLPREAIGSIYPKEMANSGIYFLTLKGNGFEKLKSVDLKNSDTIISSSYIEVINNTEAIARFDIDNHPIGEYSLEGDFADTSGLSNMYSLPQAITLQNAEKGGIEVWYKPQNRLTQPQIVNVEIRNKGNVPFYYIPFNVAARRLDGCALSFMNFDAIGINDESPEIYYTDNLLGLGIPGAMYAGIIPYLGPNETKVIEIGVEASRNYWMYAWCGDPWSEESKRLINRDWQFDESDFNQSNMLSFTRLFLMDVADRIARDIDKNPIQPIRRRPAGTAPTVNTPQPSERIDFGDDNIADVLMDLIDLVVRDTPLELPVNMAESLLNITQANAQMYGGYVNMLQLRNIEAQMQACGLDLNDPDGVNGQFYYLYEARDKIRGRIPSPLSIVGTAFGDRGTLEMAERFMNRTASCSNPTPTGLTNVIGYGIDPNDILGYIDPSGGYHIGVGLSELSYTIEFENDPEEATASALTIDVTNQLDGNVFDLSTFKATDLKLGDKSIELPEEHEFIRTLDLRPDINAIAQVEMNYDQTSGNVNWHLTTLDPMTMEPSNYFEQGILPVNDSISHRGEGMLSYSVALKSGLPDGTKVRNSASIIFDNNEPIETPVWENILDYTLPTSRLEVSTSDNMAFDFLFSGHDSGAGIWMYALYVRTPDANEWKLLRDGIEQSEFHYESPVTLPAGTIFAVLATDGAGNVQDSEFLYLQLGDVDRSGTVDANDVVALSAYYLGKPVNIALTVADTNSDGVIDAQDALAITRFYLQKHPEIIKQTRKFNNN